MKRIAPSTVVARRWEEDGEHLVDWVPEFASSRSLGRAEILATHGMTGLQFVVTRTDGVVVELDRVGLADGLCACGLADRQVLDSMPIHELAREVTQWDARVAEGILNWYHKGNPYRAVVRNTPYGDIDA